MIQREKNYGVLKNFQDILFNQVTTDRMIMLGADNWFRNDAIEKMSAEEADIVSTDYYTTGSGIKETQIATNRKYVYENGYYIRKFPHYDVPGKDQRKDTRTKILFMAAVCSMSTCPGPAAGIRHDPQSQWQRDFARIGGIGSG